VSCATALAVLQVIHTEELLENARRVGEYLQRGLRALGEQCAVIREVRGAGLFIGLELNANPMSGLSASAETKRVVNALRRRGVLVGITGSRADVVKIRPPLTFSTQHADLLLEALNEALRER
jgi:4-aminobutyrate aminotransferase-like enzyme